MIGDFEMENTNTNSTVIDKKPAYITLKKDPVEELKKSYDNFIDSIIDILEDVQYEITDVKCANIKKFENLIEEFKDLTIPAEIPTNENFNNSAESIDSQNISKIFHLILQLQKQKSSAYGRSYCRHGDLSIFFNVERKWDRISNIMEKAIKSGNVNSLYSKEFDTPTENFFDTIIDLASYSLLWAGYITETHPEVLENFIKTNKINKS